MLVVWFCFWGLFWLFCLGFIVVFFCFFVVVVVFFCCYYFFFFVFFGVFLFVGVFWFFVVCGVCGCWVGVVGDGG